MFTTKATNRDRLNSIIYLLTCFHNHFLLEKRDQGGSGDGGVVYSKFEKHFQQNIKEEGWSGSLIIPANDAGQGAQMRKPKKKTCYFSYLPERLSNT